MANKQTNLRIAQVNIHAFRGIPNCLSLNLLSESGREPQSLILFGDNGSGKSSIADAIEFALQARFVRKSKADSDLAPSVISFAGDDLPFVQLLLSDGSVVEIGFFIDEDGNRDIPDKLPHPLFSISPFVLRRADILRFHDTPDSERLRIFFEYLRLSKQSAWEESPKDKLERLRQERLEEKKRRRELISRLAQRLRIPVDDIPIDPRQFNKFVQRKVYGEISGKAKRQIFIEPETKEIIASITEVSEKIHSLNGRIGSVYNDTYSVSKSILKEVLAKIGNHLTRAFLEISSSGFIKHIEIVCAEITDVSLSLKLSLRNGKVCSPGQILSEATLDLLALLTFLSVVKESTDHGQAKIIILDDVLQSVDSTIRVSVMDYILREFSDWQLIFTVHDHLWQNQLRDLCRRHNLSFVEREIVRWKFETGPIILDGRDIAGLLGEALNSGDITHICSKSGLLLEAICNRLSWVLPISVIRRKDDKYTLGDLWPGVQKVLRKTNIQAISQEVDKWLHLRNLVGAHYNEWALSASNQEAYLLGEAVLDLFSKVCCSKCLYWIEMSSEKSKQWSCRCGQTVVEVV